MTASPSPTAPRSIVFLDVDGTLLTYELALPDSAVAAIRRARAVGHRVVLTTGRSRPEIPQEIWDIGIDGMIGGNGMYVEYDGEVLADRALAADVTAELVEWMDERELGYYLESRNGLFGNPLLPARGAAKLYGGDTEANRERFVSMLHDLQITADLRRSDVAKISFALGAEHLDDARARFGERVAVSTWSGTGNGPEFGEFALPGVDKMVAIRELLATLDGVERTIAMGDAASDLAMIEFCNVGVAMGNAEPAVQERADLVAPRVDEDGLAVAFGELGLG